ncbi:MerR family transcriptional regulator [Nonomuraea sp. NPDC002799]
MSEEDAGYGIGAVSRQLGVPAPTLRTWNLRYGLGPSRRSPGGHRRYDAADLRRLREMKRLIAEGLPPAEAAQRALTTPRGRERDPSRADAGTAHADAGTARAGAGSTRAGAGTARADAGASGAAPGTASALIRAAFMLDSHAVSALLEGALAARGVQWTWERLVLPAFDGICRRQDDSGTGIDVEHLLSDRIHAALHRLARDPAADGARPVLLACAEEEQHTLPVHALAAGLGEEGVRTRVLGARTPYTALAHAMRRLGPVAVFVWSQQAATGDTAPLATLPRLRPSCQVIVGGPGWRDDLPAGAIRVRTFREAMSQIRRTIV